MNLFYKFIYFVRVFHRIVIIEEQLRNTFQIDLLAEMHPDLFFSEVNLVDAFLP